MPDAPDRLRAGLAGRYAIERELREGQRARELDPLSPVFGTCSRKRC